MPLSCTNSTEAIGQANYINCQNGGIVLGKSGYCTCDCSGTGYLGDLCQHTTTSNTTSIPLAIFKISFLISS